MQLPSPLRDHLFVRVDAASLDRAPSGLYIPDWQPGDKDAVAAEVVAVPVGLSRERPLDYPHMDGRAYTYADLQELPQVGETVYLQPNTFKPELEYPGHPGVFLVALEKVVAVAGPDGLRPFQGLLLCEEVYDDDVRQRPDGVRERVKDASFGKFAGTQWTRQEVVTELNPSPQPCILRILHAGQPLRRQESVVKVGDVVVADRRLFVYHATNQNDTPNMDRATELGKYVLEPPTIVIDGTTYAYVPRQMVLGVQALTNPYAELSYAWTTDDMLRHMTLSDKEIGALTDGKYHFHG